jgi:hypothetical protein
VALVAQGANFYVPNRAKCAHCGSIIESKSQHDFVYCSCKRIAVDGGLMYYRRVGYPEDFAEMTEEERWGKLP